MTIQKFAATLREIVSSHADPEPAVAASAGCDSNAVLLALLDSGKRPSIITFTLDDRRSRDSLAAEENARRLGLPFHLAVLPSDPAALGDLARATFESGLRGKANIEAMTPLREVIFHASALGHRTLFTGLLSDSHFGVMRSEVIRYRHAPIADFDHYRRNYFETGAPVQVEALKSHGARFGVDVQIPFFHQRIRDLFLGHDWEELNKPREKNAVRSYPGMERLDVDRKRSNLQLGNSGVAETLAQLPQVARFNTMGALSTIAIYNAWAREARR